MRTQAEQPKLTLVQRIINNVFPTIPDFIGMLADQCKVTVEVLNTLEEFMQDGDPAKALKVREMEHLGDDIKARNMDALNKAFATPLDREDIYRAITAIDEVTNYCKTTVREMEILQLQPDANTLAMVRQIREGGDALLRGFKKLKDTPALAEEDCDVIRKTERSVEKTYRTALSELFNADKEIQMFASKDPVAAAAAVARVVEIFKRREIYRHISNTADHMAKAGHILHDIVVQVA